MLLSFGKGGLSERVSGASYLRRKVYRVNPG